MWNTACPDWEERLLARRPLVPDLPLFIEQADKAERIFNRLRIPDVIGTPTMRKRHDAAVVVLALVDDQRQRRDRLGEQPDAGPHRGDLHGGLRRDDLAGSAFTIAEEARPQRRVAAVDNRQRPRFRLQADEAPERGSDAHA